MEAYGIEVIDKDRGNIVYVSQTPEQSVVEADRPITKGIKVVATIPSRLVTSGDIVVPLKERNNIAQAVYQRTSRDPSIYIDDCFWHYYPTGRSDDELAVKFFAVRKGYMDALLDILSKHGRTASVVIPSVEALARLMPDEDKPDILLYNGTKEGLVIRFNNGSYTYSCRGYENGSLPADEWEKELRDRSVASSEKVRDLGLEEEVAYALMEKGIQVAWFEHELLDSPSDAVALGAALSAESPRLDLLHGFVGPVRHFDVRFLRKE